MILQVACAPAKERVAEIQLSGGRALHDLHMISTRSPHDLQACSHMVGISIGDGGACRYRSGIGLESFEGTTDFQGKAAVSV